MARQKVLVDGSPEPSVLSALGWTKTAAWDIILEEETKR
jgi:hypothetical protein